MSLVGGRVRGEGGGLVRVVKGDSPAEADTKRVRGPTDHEGGGKEGHVAGGTIWRGRWNMDG